MEEVARRAAPGERILLIEDSPTQAALCSDTLEEAGYSVTVAPTGEEGLARLRSQRPDLVLLDLELPGVDGFQVCAAIRDNPTLHDLPVIMLTQRSEVPAIIAGLSVGADDYVTKSEDPRALLAKMRRLLDRTREVTRLSALERLELLRLASDTLCHGVNNPLQGAFLGIELLRVTGPQDPVWKNSLEYLASYLTQVVKLVKNIRVVSEMARETFVERQQLLNIDRALEEAERLAHELQDMEASGT